MIEMKKIIICVLIIFGLIFIDNVQALLFNRSTFIKIMNNYDGGNIYRIDNGILVDTYYCVNGKKHTVIKGFSYSCDTISNYNIIDTSLEIKDFSCDSALEKIYEDDKYTYYLNCIKSEYIIVKYDNKEVNIISALENGIISISDLDKFNIKYIIEEK